MKENLINIFFPKTCPLCEKVISHEMDVCENCDGTAYIINEPKCYKCGKPLISDEKIICDDCEKINHFFQRGVALFEYKNEVKQSLYRFKYDNQRVYADFYAKLAARQYLKLLEEWKIDVIIPVPMYHKKKVMRGYNQAEEFAGSLSQYTNIPVDNKCLIRTKNTIPQKGLNHDQRKLNMENAFGVNLSELKAYKNILLVDDIYTTGSTVDGCAGLLKKAGARKVYYLCIAIGKDN